MLIVEDDSDLRRMYRAAIALAGFDVEEALDGIDALRGTANQEKGVLVIVEALNAYGEHFDHPHWKPIAVGAH